MRVHITLEDELVHELDRRVGARRRSSFIAGAVRQALDDERRWELIESALGSIAGEGHEWDDDSAAWVGAQRRADPSRVG
jgi:Arc/MetJ-type ribon-helix-helix transcriptional regulator